MFTGSCVALVTPMKQNNDVDYDALSELAKWHVAQGTSAVVALGTTGESCTLDDGEQQQVLGCVLETIQKKIPVIAGTGSFSTQATIEKTKKAKALGCEGALVVTPYYNRPTQEGLYQHFAALTQAVPLPIILYNVPSRTACDLLPETVAKISKLPNIIGIKEATGDLSRISRLAELCEVPFKLYSGDDGTACDFMAQGGHGVISVVANVVPNLFQRMCDFVFKGELSQAQKINDKLKPLYRRMSVETNPIPIKWALHAMNKIPSGIRLPLTQLSSQYHGEVTEVLQQVGAIDD